MHDPALTGIQSGLTTKTLSVEPQRPPILEEYAIELDAIAGVITTLEMRLSPILRPAYDGPNCSIDAIEPVQSTIRDLLDGLGRQKGRLIEILDRLEV